MEKDNSELKEQLEKCRIGMLTGICAVVASVLFWCYGCVRKIQKEGIWKYFDVEVGWNRKIIK